MRHNTKTPAINMFRSTIALLFLTVSVCAQPRITKQAFIVNGKPFLVLGGELGNSSASSEAYMKPLWPKFGAMHLNTILSPVYWELMEPTEGRFDFSQVDMIIKNARVHQLKVVLLWFGSWKNSMSCYAPAWVKQDQQRFPRAGRGLEILSAFDDHNLQADIRAFKALMKHIREMDAVQQTVILVQVENEVGLLTEAREHTPQANALFEQPVPTVLVDYLVQHKDSLVPELRARWEARDGNWEHMFGKSLETDEIFQAWYYARYVNAVASAGKSVYNLPMYVNAALNYKNVKPGQYPSAGPLPQVMDIWQAGAPAIDMLSPDFYNPYFRRYCDLYNRRNNTFFIPEIRFEPDDAAKVFLAIGHYKSLGFSPFSLEETEHPGSEPVAKSYDLLRQLTPLILAHKPMEGFLVEKGAPPQTIQLGKYKITVDHELTLGWSRGAKDSTWAMGGGLIIQTGEDEFVVAGTGIVCTFSLDQGTVGILSTDEGRFENGVWIAGRRMNGDQDHQGRHVRISSAEWGIQKVRLYSYQ